MDNNIQIRRFRRSEFYKFLSEAQEEFIEKTGDNYSLTISTVTKIKTTGKIIPGCKYSRGEISFNNKTEMDKNISAILLKEKYIVNGQSVNKIIHLLIFNGCNKDSSIMDEFNIPPSSNIEIFDDPDLFLSTTEDVVFEISKDNTFTITNSIIEGEGAISIGYKYHTYDVIEDDVSHNIISVPSKFNNTYVYQPIVILNKSTSTLSKCTREKYLIYYPSKN